jgi:hypothetical protein
VERISPYRFVMYALAIIFGAALMITIRPPPDSGAAACGTGPWNSVASPGTNGRGVRVKDPGLTVDNDAASECGSPRSASTTSPA